MRTLAAKLRGYWNYYGVRGNMRSLTRFHNQCRKLLIKWLNRRSQRRSCTYGQLDAMLLKHAAAAKNSGSNRPAETDMTLQERSAKRATLKSPVRENRTPGFMRGHPGDRVPYLDRIFFSKAPLLLFFTQLGTLC
jgi:hypothetical protein